MLFPMDDPYWADAANFVKAQHSCLEQLLAPIEFKEMFPGKVYLYGSTSKTGDFPWAIIHKGMMDQIDPLVLKTIVEKFVPVFANEVFVIFTNRNDLPTVHQTSPHLISFEKKMKKAESIVAILKRRIANLNLWLTIKRAANQSSPLGNKLAPHIMLDNYGARFVKSYTEATKLLSSDMRPNINPVWRSHKDLRIALWGYKQLARSRSLERITLINRLPEPQEDGLKNVPLASKACTQKDIESDWCRYWIKRLCLNFSHHRKLWELAYVCQMAYSSGKLQKGYKALGFGCGEERLSSFFATWGLKVVATDLAPEDSKGLGWVETGQHTGSLEKLFYESIADRKEFEENVCLEYVDMNCIPEKYLQQYDLVWSVCALEHLGSRENGKKFILESAKCLKPGGVAIHTTEYNFDLAGKTIDSWPTVLFTKDDFMDIAQRLEKSGFTVAPLNFEVGNDEFDSLIDIPPYSWDEHFFPLTLNLEQTPHLKLSVDGFPVTCFALVVRSQVERSKNTF